MNILLPLLRSIFYRTPKIGERFYYDLLGDPFEEGWEVEVTETRSGWVQYKYVDVAKLGTTKRSISRSGFHACFTSKRSSNNEDYE